MSLGKSQLLGLRDYIRGYKVLTGFVSKTGIVGNVIEKENTIGALTVDRDGVGSITLYISGIMTDKSKLWFYIGSPDGATQQLKGYLDVGNELFYISGSNLVAGAYIGADFNFDKVPFELRYYF